jgi:RimJ/RimL family protein N-acetyltransferase
MEAVLQTRRLLLRPVRLSDAEPLHLALSDPHVMRYWGGPVHRSLEETMAWLSEPVAPGREFAIVRAGEVIGRVAFWQGQELGFLIRRAFQGQGYGYEALRALCAYGFRTLGLPWAEADVDPRNEACLRLLRKLGFEETGRAERTWRVEGEWADSVYLKLWPAGFVRGQGAKKVAEMDCNRSGA